MVNYCIVCKTERRPLDNRSFHRFPKDEILLNKWVDNTGLSRERITVHSKICSNHFNTDDYSFIHRKKRILKNQSVPKSNVTTDVPAPPHTMIASMHKSSINLADSEITITENFFTPFMENRNVCDSNIHEIPKKMTDSRKLGGMSRNDFSSEQSWKVYRKNYLRLKNQLRNVNRNNIRRKRTRQKLLKLIRSLKSQNSLEAAAYVENLPVTLKQLMFGIPSTKKCKKVYSSEVKTFAIRLRSYSTQAYRFLRTQFFQFLPSISTLNRWIAEGELGEPDRQREVIMNVAANVKDESNLILESSDVTNL